MDGDTFLGRNDGKCKAHEFYFFAAAAAANTGRKVAMISNNASYEPFNSMLPTLTTHFLTAIKLFTFTFNGSMIYTAQESLNFAVFIATPYIKF